MKKLTITILILILLSDLWYFNWPYLKLKNIKEMYPPIDNRAVSVLNNEKQKFRILNRGVGLTAIIENSLDDIGGYDATYLKSYENYMKKLGNNKEYKFAQYIDISDLRNFNLLRELNVKYVLSSNEYKNQNLSNVGKFNNFNMYRVINTYPRAYTLPEKNNSLISVTFTHYSPNRIVLKVNSNHPDLLILSEIFYPGWKAFVNSNEVKITPYKGIFRSIPIKKGLSIVEFKFEPVSYTVGKAISLTSLFVFLVVTSTILVHKLRSKSFINFN